MGTRRVRRNSHLGDGLPDRDRSPRSPRSTWALNDLNNTTHFSTARSRAYAASAATDVAISSVRTTPVAGTPTAPLRALLGQRRHVLVVDRDYLDGCLVQHGDQSGEPGHSSRNHLDVSLVAGLFWTDVRRGPPTAGRRHVRRLSLRRRSVAHTDLPDVRLRSDAQRLELGALRGQSSITWTSASPAAAIVGGASYTPAASATSGLPVSFTLDALSVGCTLFGGVVNYRRRHLHHRRQSGGKRQLDRRHAGAAVHHGREPRCHGVGQRDRDDERYLCLELDQHNCPDRPDRTPPRGLRGDRWSNL